MDQVKIGKFIAELRKEKNMTQQQLGDKIGVSFKTISKWENGRGMPELSLLKPLSEELGVTINEILSGERIQSERYLDKLEENMINTIEYSEEQKEKRNKVIGIVLLIVGFLITLTAISIFPSESSWSSIYSVAGTIVALIGFSKLIRKLQYGKRLLLNFGFFIAFIALLFVLDFVNVVNNHQPPRFSLKTTTGDKMIIYDTPFYDVYRINRNTKNEYYVIDIKGEYTENTVPVSPFNRDKSGIDNISKYQNKYIGNNSNIGNLINNLPLSKYGYVFEIDSNNLVLTIDYHITDWYISDEFYVQKSLIYNSVSIFALIENVEYIEYNFSGSSYKITRKTIEDNYPHYSEIVQNENINKEKFNQYLENKMNDNEFVETIYQKIFEK
ncbi:MAG: helix-turn-helix domain-containing protein [Clostridia bacterium]|nr:helix-turn-helix domain-containing protein [Clostridia bacterium]